MICDVLKIKYIFADLLNGLLFSHQVNSFS